MHSSVYTSWPFVQRNTNFLKYWPKLVTTWDGLEAQNLVMTSGGRKSTNILGTGTRLGA